MANHSVLLLSGGIDSTLVLADRTRRGDPPLCLIFDYGQKLISEIGFAKANAERYGAQYIVFRLPLQEVLQGCALIRKMPGRPKGDGTIPKGRTVAQIRRGGTPPSYVPFRNGIFLAIAASIAEDRGMRDIYCGGNGLASGNYPDDTEKFAVTMQAAINQGTAPGWKCRVLFPNAGLTKAGVVHLAVSLGVDLERTWSCYMGGRKPCGVCDSCVQRVSAGAPL